MKQKGILTGTCIENKTLKCLLDPHVHSSTVVIFSQQIESELADHYYTIVLAFLVTVLVLIKLT